nr:THAP domain-containing protein 2-like [Dermacentor andersoni]
MLTLCNTRRKRDRLSCIEVAFLVLCRFPRSNPQLYQRWVVNLKRDKWTPSPGSRLCSDHFEEGCFDRTGARIRLLRDAVPTLFSFPKHLQKKTAGRKPPKERTPAEDTTPENEPTTSTRTSTEDNLANLPDHNYAVFESPKTLKRKMDLCVDSVVGVNKKLKVSLERERRLRKKVCTFTEIISDLKEKNLVSEDASAMLERCFSGAPLEIMQRLLKHAPAEGDKSVKYSREKYPLCCACLHLRCNFTQQKPTTM